MYIFLYVNFKEMSSLFYTFELPRKGATGVAVIGSGLIKMDKHFNSIYVDIIFLTSAFHKNM